MICHNFSKNTPKYSTCLQSSEHTPRQWAVLYATDVLQHRP